MINIAEHKLEPCYKNSEGHYNHKISLFVVVVIMLLLLIFSLLLYSIQE